jgi:methylenetetrahydrofolate reductase (NADPH)
MKKIAAGAEFIITQLGYDICKFEELIRFLKENSIDVPVLGNIFVPSLTVAKLMHHGKVPGIVFPEKLVRLMKNEENRGDRKARLLRAAKMICILNGLGYSGVHLGGNGLSFDDVRSILDMAEQLSSKWNDLREDVHFPVQDTWYLYRPERTGACGMKKNRLQPGRLSGSQKVHRIFHTFFFDPPSPASRLFGEFCLFCDRSRIRRTILSIGERWLKNILFYCKMCGDCTLPETTYICPQSGCPKNLLNGPCGGSRNQTCEVYPDRYCFWVRVYNRVERTTTVAQLGKSPYVPPRNWALDRTSSWINFYTGRDHCRITFPKSKD